MTARIHRTVSVNDYTQALRLAVSDLQAMIIAANERGKRVVVDKMYVTTFYNSPTKKHRGIILYEEV